MTDYILAVIMVLLLLIWLQGSRGWIELRKKPGALKMKASGLYGKLYRRIKKWRTR
jgi:hypothetical protein